MRVFTLVLLMLLLPLRAWAGDAMALSMLQGPATAHTVVCEHAAPAHDHGTPEAHAHAHAHDDHHAATADADASADGQCLTHVACDVCNGPVLSLPAWQPEGSTARHRLEVATATPFASLVPHRHHKPPIA